MRRTLLAPLGLSLFLPALPALAMPPDCIAALALPPVSPYVQAVLTRTDRALAAADAFPTDPAMFDLSAWLREGLAAVGSTVDATNVTMARSAIMNNSACLSFDAFLLKCEMQKVIESMNTSIANGSSGQVDSKRRLLPFLHERLRMLHDGASVPGFQDGGWNVRQAFDAPGIAIDPAPSCPFHSDYLPAVGPFGCSAEVLAPRSVYPPAAAELAALTAVGNQRTALLSAGGNIETFERDIGLLTGQQGTAMSPLPPSIHRRAFGCTPAFGFCALAPQQSCAHTSDCGGKSLGQCIADASTSPILHARNGAFRTDEDTLTLLQQYLAVERDRGASRSFLPALTPQSLPSYLQENLSAVRNALRAESEVQGALTATIVPQAVDVPLTLSAASPLRPPLASLASLASDRNGLRQLVKNFASFVLRSCLTRPGQSALLQAARIADADACFRYTSGAFLGDTPEKPGWKECVKDACIEGMGVALPASCSEQ